MNEFLEILKYLLPSMVMFVVAFYFIKVFLDNQVKKQELQIRETMKKTVLPIRLQAYERIVLLLERISPAGLVLRVGNPAMSADQLKARLISTIREEYEHNLSQQLYVSSQAWELVKNAKEEVIKLVHTASGDLEKGAKGPELGKAIIEKSVTQGNQAINHALEFIKKEIQEFY
jgi:hypothetical protein